MTPFMDIADHLSQLLTTPACVRLEDNLFALRFESMKVSLALTMVERLLKEGVVRKGDTLVDTSTGTYAYALALVCQRYGLACHLVIPDTEAGFFFTYLRLLGAKVERFRTQETTGQGERVARVREILQENPRAYWTQQYHDTRNYEGYAPIAQFILERLGAERLTLVGGVGTGTSTGGVTVPLRAACDRMELVGVDSFGSVSFGASQVEDQDLATWRRSTGIGTEMVFKNIRHKLYDRIHWVSFSLMAQASVQLLRRYGLFAGPSSGAAYLVASHEAQNRPKQRHVFLVADTGHRYTELFTRYGPLEGDAAPREITSLEEIELPWSFFPWNRQTAPWLAGS